MLRRDQRILLGLAALTLLLALVHAATGMGGDVLLAAPALVLLLPLLAGRYLGEERIARLGAHRHRPRRRPAVAPAGGLRPALRLMPRGGRLIPMALAHRGPPAGRLLLAP